MSYKPVSIQPNKVKIDFHFPECTSLLSLIILRGIYEYWNFFFLFFNNFHSAFIWIFGWFRSSLCNHFFCYRLQKSEMTISELKPNLKAGLSLGEKSTEMKKKTVKFANIPPDNKFKRLSTFEFYILPAISFWTTTSQIEVQLSTENLILLLTSVYPKSKNLERDTINTNGNVRKTRFLQTLNTESNFLLAAAVYGACTIVFVQFISTLYLLYSNFLPPGFVTLISLMLTIIYFCYQLIFFYLNHSDKCIGYDPDR